LEWVVLKHARDAFPPGEALEAQWREMGYKRRPDPSRASEEHDALSQLLTDLGVRVDLLPRNPDTGVDSIYVRDASIVTDRGVILCSMGKPGRRTEPKAQGDAFDGMGVPILGAIEEPGRLEGGDFLWLDLDMVVVGRGYRTNDEGIRQVRDLLSESVQEIVVVPLPHWRGPGDVFHLMSIISPLDRDLALVHSPLLPVPFRELLISRGIGLVEVPREEFESMGCNVLAVAPRVCVMLEGNPGTRRRLEEAGVEVHAYRGEEISVPGEGGPTCLTRPMLRGP
jgi:N-dimethylarginine dimethylaminohydrolase